MITSSSCEYIHMKVLRREYIHMKVLRREYIHMKVLRREYIHMKVLRQFVYDGLNAVLQRNRIFRCTSAGALGLAGGKEFVILRLRARGCNQAAVISMRRWSPGN